MIYPINLAATKRNVPQKRTLLYETTQHYKESQEEADGRRQALIQHKILNEPYMHHLPSLHISL